MPFSLHGIGVSRGYAIGRTYLLERNQQFGKLAIAIGD